MLTCPSEACFFGDWALKNRRRVDKGSKIQRATMFLDGFPEFFESVTQKFVVVTPQGVTADVTQRRIFQRAGKRRVGGKIVHANADDAQGTWQ
ncbi:hypothetical protein D3C80_1644990 [compost metagenome]